MNTFKTLITTAALFAAAPFAAQAQPVDHGNVPGLKVDQPAASELTDGEVRKIDMDNQKITLRHADIKNLDMPAMTMVFKVKDMSMLDKIGAGDKVRFRAEKVGGAIVVTALMAAK
jgi:Cu/Ag efflux protein CusF